jgi:BASS family bile acid:Na+ symporter
MTVAALAALSLKVSLLFIVVSTGMSGRRGDIVALLRTPGLLFRSILSMLIVAPVIAAALATTRELPPAIKIALVMLAVSPVPPFLPGKELRAGGRRSYVISLLAISAMLSIVTIPLTLQVLSRTFGLSLSISAMEIAKPVAITVLIPLVAGLTLQRLAPAFSASWARRVSIVGMVLLLIGAIPQLYRLMPAFRQLAGDGTLAVFAGYAIFALLIGHLLGGPVSEDRTVLALCTATRHPFIAIVLSQANFGSEKLVGPAIILALLVTMVASAPYVAMRRRPQAPDRAKAPPPPHHPPVRHSW